MEEAQLPLAVVEQLLKSLPPADQLGKLRAFEGADLADSERFALDLASVPRLHVRLDALLFKMRLEEVLGELKPELAAVTEALKKVRIRCFLKFLD